MYRENSNSIEECYATSENSDEVNVTESPVIGILTTLRSYEPYNTYVMRAYEYFVSQWGAKAVPIKQFDSDEDTLALLEKINGVIIPGGTILIIDEQAGLSRYGSKVKLIVEKAKEMNDRGIHFPIWGVCLGFQAITCVESMDPKVLKTYHFDSMNVCDKLEFKVNPSESRQLRDFSQNLIEALKNEKITYNYHHDGVYPESFEENEVLRENYNLIATTTDRKGVEYAAIIEHKRYPIYAHQSHPEKIQFVNKEGLRIPKSKNATDAAKLLAKFFVSECRKNAN